MHIALDRLILLRHRSATKTHFVIVLAVLIDRSYAGSGNITSVDEELDFWEYEAGQHAEVADTKVVRRAASRVDERETHERPEYVVPKIKYTRESKGLKPKDRVFSRDRQTVPNPRTNPYSVLMKMIDPANDDEYLDSDSRWQSSGKLKDNQAVIHDMNSAGLGYSRTVGKVVVDEVRDDTCREKFRLDTADFVESVEEALQQDEALDAEQDGDMKSDLVFGSFEETGSKWHLTGGDGTEDMLSDEVEGGEENLDRDSGDVGSSRSVVDERGPSQQLDSVITQGSDELRSQLALRSTEDSIDEEGDLVTGYGHVRISDIWSDSEDEDDDFDDDGPDGNLDAESVTEETTDGEDPLRRFLNSRSGNRDSKLEGRVFKFNKAARKPGGVQFNEPGLYRSGSLILGKETLRRFSNLKDRSRLVSRANPEETVIRFNRSNEGVFNQGSEKQSDASAVREVLQIAYNVPKDRVFEDYMAPFVSRFSNIQANLILDALCGDDLTDQMLSFFRWMRLHDPCLWDSRSFSLLFTFLGRMDMPDQALVYFGMLPEEKQFHCVQVYNSLITCLVNCSRRDEVPSVLEKMQKLGCEPDAVTFSILMNSAVNGGRPVQEVWALYLDMVQRGVCPSITVFGSLIKAFCDEGYLKEALLITTEMEKLKVPINVVIYNILIGAYGRAGQLEEAEGLMTEIKERGLHPNVATYNALIFGYLESKPKRQFAVAEGLIEEMETLGLQPDVVTFTMLLGAYGHEGMTENAAQVFSRMETRGVKPNSYSYTTLVNAYAAGRWPEKAAIAFEMMQREGIRPTVETFTALMDAYRLAGDLDMVNTVWKAMKEEGCMATRITYMTVLDAFQKQGKFKEVRDLIEEFKNRGQKPDLMVYNMLLNSYMRGGRHLKATDILQEMKRAGFLPDSFTYCTLIYGFLRVRDHTKALKYHREMMDRGQLPDAKTYAKLRSILKVVDKRRDMNNLKSMSGKRSKRVKKGTEKFKSYWKRDK